MNTSLAYQEEPWEELIGGEVVFMSPRPSIAHYEIADNIHHLFRQYLKGKTCRSFGDGVDLYLSETNHLIPDGMIVCDRSKIKPNGVHGAPDLVVEVLSPGTVRYDRGEKLAAYEKAGVREYWIVSPAGRSVEQYLVKSGHFVIQEAYTLLPEDVMECMTQEERQRLVTSFRCSLYDDLEISLYDIFENV